jgi:hypothetical protein
MTVIKIEVDDDLLATIDERADYAGLPRERLVLLDAKFANHRETWRRIRKRLDEIAGR